MNLRDFLFVRATRHRVLTSRSPLALCCGVEEIGSGENSAQLFVPGHRCYILSRMCTCVGREIANVVGVDEGAVERRRCVAFDLG